MMNADVTISSLKDLVNNLFAENHEDLRRIFIAEIVLKIAENEFKNMIYINKKAGLWMTIDKLLIANQDAGMHCSTIINECLSRLVGIK